MEFDETPVFKFDFERARLLIVMFFVCLELGGGDKVLILYLLDSWWFAVLKAVVCLDTLVTESLS
jgi:hypothetical protein